MNKKIFMIFIIFIIFIMLILRYGGNKTDKIASPGFSPSPTPVSTPKTFQFDSTTDLQKELEKVDPKVLDSDFE